MDLLLEFWGTDNGYGLWQHHLVGAVSVEVNTGEEGCLRGMSLRREKKSSSENTQASLAHEKSEVLAA